MTAKATIQQQIEGIAQKQYAKWMIGVTRDPVARKARLGNPLSWLHWQADSHQDAMDILEHFVNAGMKEAGTAETNALFVFVFLK